MKQWAVLNSMRDKCWYRCQQWRSDRKSTAVTCDRVDWYARAVATFFLFAVLPAHSIDCTGTSTGFIPINDLGSGTYLSFQGGLYSNASNARPASHEAMGLNRASGIRPLDTNGNPDPAGKYVLVSIGMSNTTQEFQAFVRDVQSDPDVHSDLVVVDGAQAGQTASIIRDPNASFWSVLAGRLSGAGLTENQVTAVWVKAANRATTDTTTYRNQLQADLEEVARVLLVKFPNLELAYFSSRIYAGYADTSLNPEPYAYESGFAVKAVIEKQLSGDAALNHDPALGVVRAPWLSWGPYMWADGLTARSDGLVWECGDFEVDGTHPSGPGEQQVSTLLLDFFKSDSSTSNWFLSSANTDTIAPAAPENLIVE